MSNVTKQILVDATLPLGTELKTYVTVQDDSKGLIKTVALLSKSFMEQAKEIIGIAYKYRINYIKVDTHGVGIGLHEALLELTKNGGTKRDEGNMFFMIHSTIKGDPKLKLDDEDLKVDLEKTKELIALLKDINSIDIEQLDSLIKLASHISKVVK